MKRVLIMDVDGTLTDGKIYIGPSGEEFKAFNIKDGYGIKNICHKNGIITVVLTGRQSDIVSKRCNELNVSHIYQGVVDKVNKIYEISSTLNIPLSGFAYIGDDSNDEECISLINQNGGTTACPADGNDDLLRIVNFKCKKNGGDGAVREFIDYLVSLCYFEPTDI